MFPTRVTVLFALVAFLVTLISAAPVLEKRISSCYKHAALTQYWIPKQGDKDMLNDGKVVTLNGSKNKALKDDNGKTIAKVSKVTYDVSFTDCIPSPSVH